jgi:predicted O-methyltransferase YrrM
MNYNNLFFTIYNNKKSKIEYIKDVSKDCLKYFFIKTYDNLILKIKNNKHINNKLLEIDYYMVENNELFFIFNINYNKAVHINCFYNKDNILEYYITKIKYKKICKQNKCKKKFNFILNNTLSFDIYSQIKDMNYCERQIYLKTYYLNILLFYYDVLEKNGDSCITIFSYCDSNVINIIYLLSLMFKEIIIYNATNIYCKSFLSQSSLISKNDIQKCIESKNFNVSNKDNIINFIKYINNIYINKVYIGKFLLNKNYHNKYINYKIQLYLEYFIKNNLLNSPIYNKFITNLVLHYNYVIINNKIIKINSSMQEEYNFINNIITTYNYKEGLELGMNYGLISYYILLNNSIKLISIDDEQNTKWNNIGLQLLKNNNLIKKHKFINNIIIVELQILVKKKYIFDFIYIDTSKKDILENIYVILYYLNILLNIGGIIIFNNSSEPKIKIMIKDIKNKYTNLNRITCPNKIICYKKILDLKNNL